MNIAKNVCGVYPYRAAVESASNSPASEAESSSSLRETLPASRSSVRTLLNVTRAGDCSPALKRLMASR